jgi:hypothetical protein
MWPNRSVLRHFRLSFSFVFSFVFLTPLIPELFVYGRAVSVVVSDAASTDVVSVGVSDTASTDMTPSTRHLKPLASHVSFVFSQCVVLSQGLQRWSSRSLSCASSCTRTFLEIRLTLKHSRTPISSQRRRTPVVLPHPLLLPFPLSRKIFLPAIHSIIIFSRKEQRCRRYEPARC